MLLQKCIAIALWKLTSPDSYRSAGIQSILGRSTIGTVFIQAVKAIHSLLLRRVLSLGNMDPIITGFAAMGFPNCRGVIDTTHIPILAPDHRAADYIDRKGDFSMVLQALVGHGPVHRHLRWMVGESACRPHIPEFWSLPQDACCIVVEGTLSRLQGRFQSLLTCLDLDDWNIPSVVAACCMLHNICDNKGETFLVDVIFDGIMETCTKNNIK
nr:protein ANTAGONIST OF LIKE HETEROCHROMATIN PROTEIN 1-like [Pelodiscus sinensis]|eukprot:XP_025036193.1 protein ANTAGONIST OF LIKE HETEROCHROMATIN PROTEIN 1-like [Pelodiscus sinensis]